MSFASRVYGLALHADRPIPGLAPVPADSSSIAPDLVVHWGTPSPAADDPWRSLFGSDVLDDDRRPLFTLDRSDADARLFRLAYGDGTTFWIRSREGGLAGADEIWAWWPDGLTSEDASTYFVGPVLGYLLRMRGQVVLHASAVALTPGPEPARGAVALVGPPGAGKSTTAAAFARRGHRILTEDACALAESGPAGGPFVALPGYPLVRLWSDSVEMLYGHPEALPLLTPTWDKRFLPLGEGEAFHGDPLPLEAIVVLDPREDADDAPRAEPLPPAEAFIQLVANTYRNLVLSREQRVEEFRGLHRLLRATPVYRIIPHADPARLDALLDVILRAVAAEPPSPS